MSLEAMIGGLSREEKLVAMELIWRDLATNAQSFVSPDGTKRFSPTGSRTPLQGEALPLTEAKAAIKKRSMRVELRVEAART